MISKTSISSKRRPSLKKPFSSSPSHVLHDDEGHVAVVAVLVDADDAGVLQAPAGLRLALEARDRLLHLGGVEVLGEDRLDRDPALDHRVEALVHHAHRALAEGADDLVLADLLGDGLGHERFG